MMNGAVLQILTLIASKNIQAISPAHLVCFGLKAESLLHQSQTKTYVHLVSKHLHYQLTINFFNQPVSIINYNLIRFGMCFHNPSHFPTSSGYNNGLPNIVDLL